MTPVSTVPPVPYAAAAAGSTSGDAFFRMVLSGLSTALVLAGLLGLVKVMVDRARRKPDPLGGAEVFVMMIVGGLVTPYVIPHATGLVAGIVGRVRGGTSPSATGSGSSPSPSAVTTPAAAPPSAPASSSGSTDTGVLVWAVAALAVVLALAVVYWLAARVRRDARAALDRRSRAREVRARQEAQWQAWADRHRDLNQRVLDTETDWDTMFYKPALTDVSIPVVADAWEAWRALGTVDPAVPRHVPQEDDVADYPYPRAVAAATSAWEAADQYAARVGQDLLPKEERRTLRRVRDLLSQAENEASSVNERALAYQQVERLLGTLRHVTPPPRAVAQLEADRTRLRPVSLSLPHLQQCPQRYAPLWLPGPARPGWQDCSRSSWWSVPRPSWSWSCLGYGALEG